jgi:hypothetical protein
MKAEIKTKQTEASVEDYINTIKDENKRRDSFALVKLMEKASGEKPKLWGSSIIGFGFKVYKSPATGREVDWFRIGFAPRKANFSLYLTVGIGQHPAEIKNLGKYKTGGGCIYINKLDDVDLNVLKTIINESLKKNK